LNTNTLKIESRRDRGCQHEGAGVRQAHIARKSKSFSDLFIDAFS
jgi:hypothetical protein